MKTFLIVLGWAASLAAVGTVAYVAGGYTCHTQAAIKGVKKQAKGAARDFARQMQKFAEET